MNTSTYHFNAQAAFLHIEAHLRHWSAEVEAKQFVVGISGGKDSAVVAAPVSYTHLTLPTKA